MRDLLVPYQTLTRKIEGGQRGFSVFALPALCVSPVSLGKTQGERNREGRARKDRTQIRIHRQVVVGAALRLDESLVARGAARPVTHGAPGCGSSRPAGILSRR
jgi:hypothetical protein